MVCRCCLCALICCLLKVPWVLEQPGSSLLEWHPYFQLLCKRFKIFRVIWKHAGMLGEDTTQTWCNVKTCNMQTLHVHYIALPFQFLEFIYCSIRICTITDISRCYAPTTIGPSEAFVWVGSYGGGSVLVAFSACPV